MIYKGLFVLVYQSIYFSQQINQQYFTRTCTGAGSDPASEERAPLGRLHLPTYLPAHFFQTKDDAGNTRDFNLIDGGVAANNPVSVS